jgi:hypothetical protein
LNTSFDPFLSQQGFKERFEQDFGKLRGQFTILAQKDPIFTALEGGWLFASSSLFSSLSLSRGEYIRERLKHQSDLSGVSLSLLSCFSFYWFFIDSKIETKTELEMN